MFELLVFQRLACRCAQQDAAHRHFVLELAEYRSNQHGNQGFVSEENDLKRTEIVQPDKETYYQVTKHCSKRPQNIDHRPHNNNSNSKSLGHNLGLVISHSYYTIYREVVYQSLLGIKDCVKSLTLGDCAFEVIHVSKLFSVNTVAPIGTC